jgi:hypothetical protein
VVTDGWTAGSGGDVSDGPTVTATGLLPLAVSTVPLSPPCLEFSATLPVHLLLQAVTVYI